MTDAYRQPGHVESDEGKVARLRAEYDHVAISAQTTPDANARALRRMREISAILLAMRRTP